MRLKIYNITLARTQVATSPIIAQTEDEVRSALMAHGVGNYADVCDQDSSEWVIDSVREEMVLSDEAVQALAKNEQSSTRFLLPEFESGVLNDTLITHPGRFADMLTECLMDKSESLPPPDPNQLSLLPEGEKK